MDADSPLNSYASFLDEKEGTDDETKDGTEELGIKELYFSLFLPSTSDDSDNFLSL